MFEKKKSFDGPVTATPPPIPETALVSLLTGQIPQHFPSRPLEAAKFWIQRQEPQTFSESPQFANNKDGEGSWKCPYNDRLQYTLAKFLSMSDAQQMFILDHITRGYPWRGDDISFYKMVIAETDQMMIDPEAYKAKHAELRAKGFI